MAVQRTARVTAVDDSSAAAGVRALVLAMPEPLGFVGGQYLIVDSGLTLPSGKAAKRAYSLLGELYEATGRTDHALNNEPVDALAELDDAGLVRLIMAALKEGQHRLAQVSATGAD